MVDQLGLANEWFVRLSEPVSVRKAPVREHYFFRNLFIGPFRELLNDWYRPLTEPVRARIPSPRGAWPTFIFGINYVQFTLAVTEQGDTIALLLTTATPKNLARVTITEIETYSGGTTIKEIVQGREYS